MLDARWILSDRGEIYLNGSLSRTDAAMGTMHMHAYSDVPIDLIDPDADPGELPGPGHDEDAGSALRFHDYDFTQVHEYSDLEYDELRVTLGANFQLLPAVGLFGAVSLYDLDDSAPYLQDVTGAVSIISGGIVWTF